MCLKMGTCGACWCCLIRVASRSDQGRVFVTLFLHIAQKKTCVLTLLSAESLENSLIGLIFQLTEGCVLLDQVPVFEECEFSQLL